MTQEDDNTIKPDFDQTDSNEDLLFAQYKEAIGIAPDTHTQNVLDVLLRATIKLRNESPGISDSELWNCFQFAMNVSEQMVEAAAEEMLRAAKGAGPVPDNARMILLQESPSFSIIQALLTMLKETPLQRAQDIVFNDEEQKQIVQEAKKSLMNTVLDAPTTQTQNTDTFRPQEF